MSDKYKGSMDKDVFWDDFDVKLLKRSVIKASSINRGEGKINMSFDEVEG